MASPSDPTREWQMPGWRLVPVEPTEEMLAAAHEGDRAYTLRNFGDIMTVMQGPYDHYVAMLAAAPKAPPMPEEVAEIVRVLHGLHPRDDVNMQYMAPLFAWLSAQGLVSAKE